MALNPCRMLQTTQTRRLAMAPQLLPFLLDLLPRKDLTRLLKVLIPLKCEEVCICEYLMVFYEVKFKKYVFS